MPINKKIQNTFLATVRSGNIELINQLLTDFLPEDRQQISEYIPQIFLEATNHGDLPVLNSLIELWPDRAQEMIAADNYASFRNAANCGYLHILNRFIELLPDNTHAMIAADDYGAFCDAATNGHIAVLDRIIKLSPDHTQAMLAADDYSAFHGAFTSYQDNDEEYEDEILNPLLPVINRLLSFPRVFAYAEMHYEEYHTCIYPFIKKTLARLHEISLTVEVPEAHIVVEIPENEAHLYFYIIRHLIRQNSIEVLDELRFLMAIPAVKALLHTAVTPNEPNELVRLAISTANQTAATLLLRIPAIFDLARQHNFYQAEVQDHVDLRALATDRESSMHALTTSEQQLLDAALERYEPMIAHLGGVEVVFQSFYEALITRYKTHPAIVQTDDGRKLELPISAREFKELNKYLTHDTLRRALTAYHQHKEHTALRYVSRPNFWMARNAIYVIRDPSAPILAWSRFEEYKPLISLLWLAAKDEEIAPIDGHTLETRIEHFIHSIALIGRAHNWDKSRYVYDASGALCLDHEGKPISEEFDDGRGDKPSCYSGVKRRLFQSVLGHPLLKILTLDDIKLEQRDFLRTYFQQKINEGDRDELTKAWEHLCNTGEVLDVLHQLNVSPDAQNALLTHLKQKYQAQFVPAFLAHIEDSFIINKIYTCHVTRFAGAIGLAAFFQPPAPAAAVSSPLLQRSIFAERLTETITTAKKRLRAYDELGELLIAEIRLLQTGSQRSGDIWIGSGDKLDLIMTTFNALPEEAVLREVLLDHNSPLAMALAAQPNDFSEDAHILSQIQQLLEGNQKKKKRSDCELN